MAEVDQPGNAETASDMTSGRMLQCAREKQDMSLKDVAGHLHLAESVIRAIEQDDDANSPAAIYVRGYLRSYAAFVGIDADQVVDAYNSRVGTGSAPLNLDVNSRPVTRQARMDFNRKPVLVAGGAVIALVIVLGLVILFGGDEAVVPELARQQAVTPGKPVADKAVLDAAKQKTVVPVADNRESVPVQKKKPEVSKKPAGKPVTVAAKTEVAGKKNSIQTGKKAPAGDDVLLVRFRESSWVVVHDANRQRLLFRTAKAGREYRLTGSKPFNVFLGNAEAATIAINGKSFDHSAFTRKNKTARFVVGETSENQ